MKYTLKHICLILSANTPNTHTDAHSQQRPSPSDNELACWREKKKNKTTSGRLEVGVNRGGGVEGWVGGWGRVGGVLTLQLDDWFRLAGDPSVHSAVSVLLDCLLSSYSFSYVEKKS